jgi:hypothetical protein
MQVCIHIQQVERVLNGRPNHLHRNNLSFLDEHKLRVVIVSESTFIVVSAGGAGAPIKYWSAPQSCWHILSQLR